MKKLFCAVMLCMSFFSHAAEKPNASSFTTRGRDLGGTGAEQLPRSSSSAKRHGSDSPNFNKRFLQEENLVSYGSGYLSRGSRVADVDKDTKK